MGRPKAKSLHGPLGAIPSALEMREVQSLLQQPGSDPNRPWMSSCSCDQKHTQRCSSGSHLPEDAY